VATESVVLNQDWMLSTVLQFGIVVLGGTAPVGRHFQGVFCVPHPGLKPWAILLDHFMVENARPLINHQLLTTD